ncbi:MAG: sigma-70 family RNA polymerase sigma factor [Pedobacter sp.]|uniref:RNA polymerase sigma factor n=1 Tax=Pedobacter sp. TaxID=1411316 RepID=UPI0033935577
MALDPLVNEKELLQCLCNGDELSFEVIYRHYIDAIYRRLLYLVKSEELAEELAQDIFMRIWDRRACIDTEKSFRSYLYSIAQNLVTDYYRRLAVDRKLQQHLISTTTESYNPIELHYHAEGERHLLYKAIDSLPEQRKKVYTLVKLEGRSYEEVSELLGISASTIRDHIVKGTKSIKLSLLKNEFAVILIVASAITDAISRK